MSIAPEVYGWRRDGLIWRQDEPHLMLVPDVEPDRTDLDDVVVIRVMATLQRTLRHPRGLPLRATWCEDCGGLKSTTETICPACLLWAERDAVASSWRTTA